MLAGLVSVGMAVSANAATFYYDSYGGFIPGTGEPSGNYTVENNAEGSNNANALKNIQHSYTVYSWETSNNGYENNGYYYSNNQGSTYKCPNARPAGTLVSPVSNPTPGQIFITDGTDPNISCEDAHAFLPQEFYPTDFTHLGNKYSVVVSGFSHDNDIQNNTFWACEDGECEGTVKFEIRDVTTEVDLEIDKSVLPVTVNSGETSPTLSR